MAKKDELQKRIDELEAENASLKMNAPVQQRVQDRYMEEMNALQKKSVVGTDKVHVRLIDDHKNIKLYHTNGYHIGKIVGPLHPHNARVEMERFSRRGIILSVNQPTAEQVAAYKATDEYKRLEKAFNLGRARKVKTRSKGEIDRLAKAIEKLSGNKVVNAIADSPV